MMKGNLSPPMEMLSSSTFESGALKMSKRLSDTTTTSCKTLRTSNILAPESCMMMSMNTIFSAAETADRSEHSRPDGRLDDLSDSDEEYLEHTVSSSKRNSMGEDDSECGDSSGSSLGEFDEIAESESVRNATHNRAMLIQRKFFQEGVQRLGSSLFLGEDEPLSSRKADRDDSDKLLDTEKCHKEYLSCVRMEFCSQGDKSIDEKGDCPNDLPADEITVCRRRLSTETKLEDPALFARFIESPFARAIESEKRWSDSTSVSTTDAQSGDLRVVEFNTMPMIADGKPSIKDTSIVTTTTNKTDSSSELGHSSRRGVSQTTFVRDLEDIRRMMLVVADAVDIKSNVAKTVTSRCGSSRNIGKIASSASLSKSSQESGFSRDYRMNTNRSEMSSSLIEHDSQPRGRDQTLNMSLLSLHQSVNNATFIDEWIERTFISLQPSSEMFEISSIAVDNDTDMKFLFYPDVTKRQMDELLNNLLEDNEEYSPILEKGKRGFNGNHNKIGLRHGYGIYRSRNGSEYRGEWFEGVKQGFGVAKYNGAGIYYGHWKNNNRDGHGIMQIANGDIFEGEWRNHKKNGVGVYFYSDGDVDISLYVNDKRVGCGVRWNIDRSKVCLLNDSQLMNKISFQQADKILKRHRIEINHDE
ncbi:hypothetical protein HJC23_001311 [Cyclotella cryptica]|uniref:Uncharacterized protein n=1 Tax=Cyclotella cryptica TaxID=29204 RepID=A0ABD3P3B7_9STRA|eukprot:CCRYP_018178-RA/>CCRYP_018178-RA protein AED:0.02 eAED:0.02 QI:377/1/1/1/0.5/0.33/3/67/641